jgi:hypothetical protein
VFPLEVDGLAVDETADDASTLDQPGLAHRSGIEIQSGRGVLVRCVTGSETELEPACGQPIERDRFPRELHRIAHVVVQHERPQPDPPGRRSDRCQRHHR